MKTGAAYAIFGCKASKKEIEAQLPRLRSDSRLPINMQISLEDLTEMDISPDTDLKAAIKREDVISDARSETKRLSSNARLYGMHAKLDNQTGEETARLLSGLLNLAYSSTNLYERKEPYYGSITFQHEDGTYKTFE